MNNPEYQFLCGWRDQSPTAQNAIIL